MISFVVLFFKKHKYIICWAFSLADEDWTNYCSWNHLELMFYYKHPLSGSNNNHSYHLLTVNYVPCKFYVNYFKIYTLALGVKYFYSLLLQWIQQRPGKFKLSKDTELAGKVLTQDQSQVAAQLSSTDLLRAEILNALGFYKLCHQEDSFPYKFPFPM